MLARLSQHLQALASTRTACIELLHGRLRSDGAEVSAIYTGNGTNADYLQSLLFEAAPHRTSLGKTSPFGVAKALARVPSAVDIVLCERPPLWAAVGGRIGDVRMPAWVKQIVSLESTGDGWLLGRHLEREVDRQIRRHHYRLVVTDAATDRDVFFEQYYLPYVHARHGSGAIAVDRKRFASVAAGSTLAKLYSGDTWIAGMLLHQRGEALRLGWFGSQTNPPVSGASEVLDVLAIKDAVARGVRYINFGSSRPSLTDGVVRYKQKFGARIVVPRYPQTILELQLRSDRPSLRHWLTNQRFLCLHGGSIAVAGYPSDGSRQSILFSPVTAASA